VHLAHLTGERIDDIEKLGDVEASIRRKICGQVLAARGQEASCAGEVVAMDVVEGHGELDETLVELLVGVLADPPEVLENLVTLEVATAVEEIEAFQVQLWMVGFVGRGWVHGWTGQLPGGCCESAL
jgi:hypothetical protein